MFNAEEDLLAAELVRRARLAGAACSVESEGDASPEGQQRLGTKSLFWSINMEQIAFPTGSVAFLGSSLLMEIGILKYIVSRDLPTVTRGFSL